MSAILRALKKLEADSGRQRQSQPWPGRTGSTGIRPLPSMRPWFAKIGLPMAGLAGVLIVGGWLVQDDPVLVGDPAGKPQADNDPGISMGHSTSGHIQERRPRTADAASGGVGSGRTAGTPRASKMSRPDPFPESADHHDVPRGTPPFSRDMLQQKDQSGPPGSAESVAAAGPRPPGPRSEEPVAERKDDGRLTLQAIAWSQAPGRRMAVMNDRIVKEGSVVDGIHVVRILDNHVVVREDGLTWKVLFSLR